MIEFSLMSDSRETSDKSADQNQADFFVQLGAIEDRIESSPLEDLIKPEVAASLGLEWAEAHHRFSFLYSRSLRNSTNINPIARQLSVEKIEEYMDAIHDARQGVFTFLKRQIIDTGLLLHSTGDPVGVKLIIIGLATPNEMLPKDQSDPIV